MPRVTLYDPRHSTVDWPTAKALADVTGLKPQLLVAFRPERQALHSVLIRVTAQLFVPDGPNYADLGINLRQMAARIYEGHVLPRMPEFREAFDALKAQAEDEVAQLLDTEIYPPPPEPPKRGFFERFRKPPPPRPQPSPQENALAAIARWQGIAHYDIPATCRRSLGRVLASVMNHRGGLFVDRETLARVAVNLTLNRQGATLMGRLVTPVFDAAVDAEGYTRLSPQDAPVVLNAKGASASGKSTIRGRQRQIAEHLGLDWRDFAIISPDYWRKSLIDYDGLGEDYKYAAMMTGHELEVIDRKLDVLMAVKAREGQVPHMLIDRFRFDSFETEDERIGRANLLTSYAAKVYMFYMVTPPADTVERAWARGLETGRYKAVDDLLFHNIEAYSGMPRLFFEWALDRDKWVHYEFLDNSVPKGTPPRTIAYGANGSLTVIDLDRFCDIERFKHVNVDATGPDEILSRRLSASEAMGFVREAIRRLDRVTFACRDGAICGCAEAGRLRLDPKRLPEGFSPEDFGTWEPATEDLGRIDPAERAEDIGA